MNCSKKMNGITNEALTYFKASLIEIVFHSPMMKAVGSKKMNVSPKTWAIVSNTSVIFNILVYLLKNIPITHNTQKNIANPIKMYGISFIISFTDSNALLKECLS